MIELVLAEGARLQGGVGKGRNREWDRRGLEFQTAERLPNLVRTTAITRGP